MQTLNSACDSFNFSYEVYIDFWFQTFVWREGLLARSLWLLVVVRMKESSFDWKVKVNPDTPLSQVVHVFSYLSSFCTFYHQYFISSRLAWKCSSKEIYTKFRNTAFICSKEIIFIIKNIRIFLGGLSSLGAFLVI